MRTNFHRQIPMLHVQYSVGLSPPMQRFLDSGSVCGSMYLVCGVVIATTTQLVTRMHIRLRRFYRKCSVAQSAMAEDDLRVWQEHHSQHECWGFSLEWKCCSATDSRLWVLNGETQFLELVLIKSGGSSRILREKSMPVRC
jgi:hypothetical protein